MGIPGENILWDAAYLERVAKTGSLFLAMMAMVGKQIIPPLYFTDYRFLLCIGNR